MDSKKIFELFEKDEFVEARHELKTSIKEKVQTHLNEKLGLTEKKDKDYDAYFEKMMKKWKIKSPAELSKKDKAKFFDEVDKGWKSEKEK